MQDFTVLLMFLCITKQTDLLFPKFLTCCVNALKHSCTLIMHFTVVELDIVLKCVIQNSHSKIATANQITGHSVFDSS